MLNSAQLLEKFSALNPDQQAIARSFIKEELRRQLEEKAREGRFTPSDPSVKTVFGYPANDQLGFLMSTAKERWGFGSNRSGKSEMGVYDGVQFARGLHPVRSLLRKPPVYIRYCAPSYEDNVKRVLIKKFQQFVPRMELRGGQWDKAWSEKEKTLHFENGSTINFKSNEQDVNKFAGDDLDAVYQDEHAPAKYYRENKARLVDRDGYYVCTMTPEEGGVTWEKKHIKSRADGSIETFHWHIYANPHLSEAGVRELEQSITDERVRRIKLWGEFSALAGLIYPQFNIQTHVIENRTIPDSWYRVFCIDPHIKKASAMLWAAWSPDGDVIFYRAHKKQLTVDELKQFIRVQSAGEHISLWLGDEAMGGEGLNIWGEKSVLELLRTGENPIPVVGTNQASDKAFEAGVNKVRSMLNPDPVSKRPTLFITKDAIELADEFEEYQFMPDSKADDMTYRERVRSIDDDLVTDARYIVMAGPGVGSGGKIESGIGDSW